MGFAFLRNFLTNKFSFGFLYVSIADENPFFIVVIITRLKNPIFQFNFTSFIKQKLSSKLTPVDAWMHDFFSLRFTCKPCLFPVYWGHK